MPDKFFVEPFDKKKHDRTSFSCEHEALAVYLKQQANQDIKKNAAAVFVLAPRRENRTVAGYYTLSQYAVDLVSVPEEITRQLGLPRYEKLPATLLGRLARNLEFKGQGIGELLLMSALKKSLANSKSVASAAVVADAKDEVAKSFYKKYGFIELLEPANRLFLPMKTVEQMFAAADDVLVI